MSSLILPKTPVRLAFGLIAAAALSACGGGDDGAAATTSATTVQLKGTAATGAAIANATVTAVNAKGASVAGKTAADGSYTLDVAEGAPYLLSVADAAGKTWYSYAQAAGTANLTPLTTLALLEANGNKPLADLLKTWSTAPLDAAAVLAAAQEVNANLKTVMQGKGVDYTKANVFADAFSANGQGLDAVLDAMRVSVDCTATTCSQTIAGPQGQTLITWNGNILTTGISVSWSSASSTGTGTGTGGSSGTVNVALGSCKAPQAGTYSLLVDTTVAGVAVPVPSVCVDGLPDKPASAAEFCGSSTASGQLPPGVQIVDCKFSGDTGTILARITAPITIDYTVKYTFIKA